MNKTAGAQLWHILRQIGATTARWVHFGSTGPLEGEQRGNRLTGRRGAQAEQLVAVELRPSSWSMVSVARDGSRAVRKFATVGCC
jgi:hypothetical protein